MKIFRLFSTAAAICLTLAASAQTPDEILAKNYAAMGGVDKLNSINTIRMTGSLSNPQGEVGMVLTSMQDKGMRMDLDIMGQNNYIIATPEKGYIFFPIQGMSDPAEMEPEQLAGYANRMNLHGTLSNYKARGTELTYDGKSKEDGVEVEKIKAKSKDGKITTYFFDASNYRLIKTKGTVKDGEGNDMEVETVFSDFKQTPEGIWFAYTSTSPNGPITWSKIEVNPTVDEKIFKN